MPLQGRWDHRRTAYQVGSCHCMQCYVASVGDAAVAMQASCHAIIEASPTTMLL